MEKKTIPKDKLIITSTQGFKSSEDNDDFFIEGYASVSVKDRDWDIIPTSAIDLENFEKNPIILYQHNKAVPVGKAIEVEKRSDGLWIKVLLSKTATNVRTLIEEGILKAFSVGFILKDYYFDDNKDAFVYRDMELTETSIVSVPANQDALFSMVKEFNSNLTKPEIKTKDKEKDPNTKKEDENIMNELETLYAQFEEQVEIVKARHAKFLEKGNKTAEADTRKALGEIKKLVTPYRKASVEATSKKK